MENTLSLGGQIVKTFTDALSGIAEGFGSTVTDLFDNVVVNSEGGLRNIAIWGLTFGAINLALGLVRMFTAKVG